MRWFPRAWNGNASGLGLILVEASVTECVSLVGKEVLCQIQRQSHLLHQPQHLSNGLVTHQCNAEGALVDGVKRDAIGLKEASLLERHRVLLDPTGQSANKTHRECIDICPTRAIVAPYVLDSRRCISYLNIELKGVIPLQFRQAIGNRIYGCDDCQIVCPWNSFAVTTDEPAFHGKDGVRLLIELIRLDDEGFRSRFRHSPIKRIKRRGFLRNVAIALGNSGNLDAVAPLIEVLGDKEPLIRAHAVWALGELLQEKAPTVLWENLAQESDEMVLTEIRNVDNTFRRTSGSYFSLE